VLRRWRPQHVSMLAVQDAAHRRARSLQGLSSFLTQTLQMGMMALGGYLVTQHLASPGSILAASLLTGMASRPGSHLVAAWREWSFGTAAFTRLRATIASAEPSSPAPPEEEAPAGLVMRGLTVEVPGKVLVRHLDLGLQPGELLLVAGPNGSGKSTLLRVMLGLLAPAEGVAMLDGQDTHRADRAVIGPRIGYLPQGAQLLEGTVMENITRFGKSSAAEAVAAARQAGAHETIGRLPEGYGHGAGGNAGLSGGQRQMVALARALYGNPRLLVLDEPEAGLDQTGLVGLRAAVATAKARGAVVVLVTHQPGDWTELVDLRLRLSPGKGKAEGSWNLEIEEGAA
jgi:ATP-binding cassette subfamily C protein